MKFFQTLFGKKHQVQKEEFEYELSPQNEDGYFEDDFLGLAAYEGSKASKAIEDGKVDDAWGHYQKMSQLYLQQIKGVRHD